MNYRQTILVVDDDAFIRRPLEFILRQEGFDPVTADGGPACMEQLAAIRPDLIIMDVMMPGTDGFELCKTIRKTSAVPIIFLTARSGEIDRIVGLEIGGDDYVPKPFSPRELAARVKAVLRRVSPREGREAPAAADTPFLVDKQKMEITYFGRPLDLSRYEYRMLEVLLTRPGWVYSREKLMDMVWEAPESSMDRTVDTHIKTLRAKLRKINPELDPIRTHRGVGYSLKDSW